MKKIKLYKIVLAALLLAGLPAHAGEKLTTELKNLDDLISISQDLEENTPVYISVNSKKQEESCYCVCREGTWSCTQTECSKQNKECASEDDK